MMIFTEDKVTPRIKQVSGFYDTVWHSIWGIKIQCHNQPNKTI